MLLERSDTEAIIKDKGSTFVDALSLRFASGSVGRGYETALKRTQHLSKLTQI